MPDAEEAEVEAIGGEGLGEEGQGLAEGRAVAGTAEELAFAAEGRAEGRKGARVVEGLIEFGVVSRDTGKGGEKGVDEFLGDGDGDAHVAGEGFGLAAVGCAMSSFFRKEADVAAFDFCSFGETAVEGGICGPREIGPAEAGDIGVDVGLHGCVDVGGISGEVGHADGFGGLEVDVD